MYVYERKLQIGEDYWTTVSGDGSLLGNRKVEDFLRFSAVHHNIPMVNAYVAFWYSFNDLLMLLAK